MDPTEQFPPDQTMLMAQPHVSLPGQVETVRLQPGLMVKSVCLGARHAMVHINDVQFEPALRVVLLLQGRTHLKIGGRSVLIDAVEQPAGLWLPLWQSLPGSKWLEAGGEHDELVLFVGAEHLAHLADGLPSVPSWLMADPAQHLCAQPFVVSEMMRQWVVRWREQPPLPPLLQRLHRQGMVWQLFAEVCRQMMGQAAQTQAQTLRRGTRQRVDRLTALLHSGRADDWSLAQMAAECGSNVTTLQRHFQQYHGVGIWHYLRRLKLERAFQALQSGASVGRAAEVAGYQHIESFSKAFKQQYDCNPVQVKMLF